MMWFLGFVASYLTARTLHWPLIWGIALVAGIYLLATGGSAGITGAVGGVFGGITRAVGGIFGFLRRFLVGLGVFLLVGVLLNRLTGVDLGFAAPRFQKLGVSVWGWPAHTDMAVILYMCTMAIATFVAVQYASGNTRKATIVVLVSWGVAFAMTWMPRTVEEVRPKSSTPVATAPIPAPATTWDDAEKRLAEEVKAAKKRGPLRRAGSFLKWFAVGEDGISWPSWLHWPTPPTTRTVVEPAPTGKPAPKFSPFDVATGCVEKYLGFEAAWSPDKGTMMVTDPAGGSHEETAGQKEAPISRFAPGTWKFCTSHDATGVVIWE